MIKRGLCLALVLGGCAAPHYDMDMHEYPNGLGYSILWNQQIVSYDFLEPVNQCTLTVDDKTFVDHSCDGHVDGLFEVDKDLQPTGPNLLAGLSKFKRKIVDDKYNAWKMALGVEELHKIWEENK